MLPLVGRVLRLLPATWVKGQLGMVPVGGRCDPGTAVHLSNDGEVGDIK